MHILYVAHGYKPAYRLGGPVWSISALAEGMAARGHRVTVFTTNGNGDEDLEVPTDRFVDVAGVAVRYFRRTEPFRQYVPWLKYISQSIGYLYTPDLVPALQTFLDEVDIVHTQMPFVYPTQAVARRALARRRPLFYSQRGVFDPARLQFRSWKKSLYIQLVERPIMRRATGLVALTPDEVSSFRALGVDTPVHLVPNGIDVERFRRVPVGSLTELGISKDQTVVLFLARLHQTKGADVLVEAFARIAQRHPKSVLVLAGNDEQGLLPGLTARLAAANANARVITPGLVTGELKLDLLARADLFALPSIGEGLSMAVLEALASGTPAILSRECNLPIVETAGAGAVVERSVDEFAHALDRFLKDTALRALASDRAYALARDQFGWRPILDRLEALYVSANECAPRSGTTPRSGEV